MTHLVTWFTYMEANVTVNSKACLFYTENNVLNGCFSCCFVLLHALGVRTGHVAFLEEMMSLTTFKRLHAHTVSLGPHTVNCYM